MTASDAYRAYLEARCDALHVFPIDGLDRLGVPVWNASAWGAHGAHGAGYGTTAAAAERSALGEAVEGVAAATWADAVRPRELTVAEALAQGGVHPEALSLPAGTRVDDATRLLWVDAFTWPDGAARLLPLEAVVTSPGEFARAAGDGRDPLFPPITNGLGAGGAGDLERAVQHGLRELLQRDLNWSAFKALDTGRVVDHRAVDPGLAAHLEARGIEVVLKHSGCAFGVHAFHCAGRDADPDVLPLVRTATGEGADEDPVVAARKAMLEFCSSRSRKAFSFGGDATLAIAPEAYQERARATPREPVRERGWDLTERFDALLGDHEALERVVARITRSREPVPLPEPGVLEPAGMEVVVVALTGADDEAQAARVTVPGLEAEVLSHHRLGPRGVARLRERVPGAVADGPGDGRLPVAGTEAWVDVARLEAVAAPFLPLYREPGRHAYEATVAA